MSSIHFQQKKKRKQGFTLVELMVTVTIVVLVTGLIMIQYSSFNSSVLLRSQAFLTAFDIREAQSLAISVKGQGGEFREEYGLYFDLQTPFFYLLFQDDDDLAEQYPARYTLGEAIGTPYRVDPRFEIVNICATNQSSRTCAVADPGSTGEVVDANLSNLAITFRRPDFDAVFYNSAKSNITSAEIKFGTPTGDIERTVVVYATGQVSVQ